MIAERSEIHQCIEGLEQLPCALRGLMQHTRHQDEAAPLVSQGSSLRSQSCASSPTEVTLVLIGQEWLDGICTKTNHSKGSERNSGAMSAMLSHVQKREATMPNRTR